MTETYLAAQNSAWKLFMYMALDLYYYIYLCQEHTSNFYSKQGAILLRPDKYNKDASSLYRYFLGISKTCLKELLRAIKSIFL